MKRMRHIGIVVRDLNKCVYFYRDLLSFKIEQKSAESGKYIDNLLGLKKIIIKIVKLTAGDGNTIELLNFSPAGRITKRRICDFGYSHIALTVDNLDREYKRLKKHGVKFISLPQSSPNGCAKVAFCKDPEGNFVELTEVLEKY